MNKLVETAEGFLDEALRCEKIARESAQAGEFAIAKMFDNQAAQFLSDAAKMENENV